jgi:hypothetical protein
MLPQLQASVEDVGQKNGQRRVSLNVGGTEFGTFDGYKQSNNGTMQVATPEWIEGMTVPVVLMATMTVNVTEPERQSDSIVPATDDPSGWQHHAFSGVVDSLDEDTDQLLDEVYLFDGVSPNEPGVGLDITPYEGIESAVLKISDGAILVDLSAFDGTLSVGDTTEVTASRTDIIGYRQRQL